MSLLVRFKDRDFNESLALAGITASVESLAWAAQGGPAAVLLTVSGPELALWSMDATLRYGVEVLNEKGEAIWWGYIYRVGFQKNAIAFDLSLEEMSNSVAVAYMTADGETGRTVYLPDAASVLVYGTKQLLVSADNVTTAGAEQRQITELERRRLPIVTPPSARGLGNPGLSVVLECRGWYETLGWRYYSRAEGREVYLPTSNWPQKLGWGFTASDVGFEAGTRYLSSLTAKLGNLSKGDKVRIGGSATNNGIYTVEQGTEGEATSYTATTISCTAATSTISDSAGRLKPFFAHDTILVSGSASNNGYMRVVSAAGDGSEIVVDVGLTDEAVGATVTLARGHRIALVETLVDELPGASVTVTGLGTMAAQSFEVTSTDAWTVATAAIRVRVVGSPADNLRIAIYADAADGGALLDSATISGSNIASEDDWVTATLANTQSLTPGTTYWLLTNRTGAINEDDYYEVMVDIDLGYAPEVLELYDGSGWVARPVNANMPFRLTGLEATSTQIEELVTTAGEFIERVEVEASGISTNQYRYGDNMAQVELEALLNLGTSDDLRMVATVTRERTLIVAEEATVPSPILYFLRDDGALVDRYNQKLVDVYPPVGQWVDMKGVIPDAAQLSELLRPGPFLVERAEYNPGRQEWRLEARDALSVWDVAGIREG